MDREPVIVDGLFDGEPAAAAIVLSEGSPMEAPLVGDRRVGCAMSIRRGSDGCSILVAI